MDDDAVVCMGCGFNKKTGRCLSINGRTTGVLPSNRPSQSHPATGQTHDRKEIPEEPSSLSSFTDSFSFPLKGAALGMVIGIPFLQLIRIVPFGGAIYFAIFYSCLIDILRTAAGGPKFKVEWPDMSDFWSEMLLPALIVFFAAFIVIGIPMGITISLIGGIGVLSQLNDLSNLQSVLMPGLAWGSVLGGLVTIFCASYLPMTLIIAGIYQAFGASLNPAVLFRSISCIGKEYVLVTLFVYFILALSGIINSILGSIPFAGFLSPAITFYFWAVIASRLGFMYYYNKAKLGW